MNSSKALRKQVMAEIKLRRYCLNTVLFLILLYIASTLVFGEMGVLRYRQLKQRQSTIEGEVNAIVQQNLAAAKTIRSFDSDNFFVEKNARESFGMASPEEYIFIFKE